MSDNTTVVSTWDNVDLTEGIHTVRASALLPEITVADGALDVSGLISLPGCVQGDFVMASYTLGALNGLLVNVCVETTDSVRVTVLNETGGPLTLLAGVWNFLIFKN
jgi:hypothetical protein